MRVAGTCAQPLFDNIVSSPLYAVPKKNFSKVRVIQDLSFPLTSGVNSGININEFSQVYKNLSIQKFDSFNTSCYVAKTDLASAFSHITTLPDRWNQLAFWWDNGYYIQTCLPFGLS